MKKAKCLISTVLVLVMLIIELNLTVSAAVTKESTIIYAQKTADNLDTDRNALSSVMIEYGKLALCNEVIDKLGKFAAKEILMVFDPAVIVTKDVLSKAYDYSVGTVKLILKYYPYITIFSYYLKAIEYYNEASIIKAGGITDYSTAKKFLLSYFEAERYAQPAITYIETIANTYNSWSDVLSQWGVSFVNGLVPFSERADVIKKATECVNNWNEYLEATSEYQGFLDDESAEISLFSKRCNEFLHFDDNDPSLQTVSAISNTVKVSVNNKEYIVPAYNINSNNYFKIRDLATIMTGTSKQFSVDWDNESNRIDLRSGQSYTMVGGEMQDSGGYVTKTATKSSATIYLDDKQVPVLAYMIENSNYFMLRDIASALGFYVYWRGSTMTIEISSTKNYVSAEPVIPTLYSPSSGTTIKVGQTASLNWSNTGATKYRLECINDSDTGTFGTDVYETSYNFTPSNAGSWRWQVRSYLTNGDRGDASPTRSITVNAEEYQPSDKPTLLSPSNGSTFTGSTPTLHWSSVSSPSGGQVKYKVEVFNSPNDQISDWITETSWTPNTTKTGLYNWHVKSIDVKTGKESGWGSVWQFSLSAEYQPSDKPTLLSPSNGSTFTGSTPTLHWSSVSSPSGGQVKYKVEVFNSPNDQISDWITETSWTPNTTKTGLYNWHVKSIDVKTGKESGWGVVWQFSLSAEYQPSDKPTLLSPSNGSTFTGSTPTLHWSSVSSPSGGQVKYKVEVFNSPNDQISDWITETSWTPNTTKTGLYNWHVKSIDVKTGKESGWGVVWQFSLSAEYQPSDKPTLLSPANGSVFTGNAPTLYWSSVSSPSGGQVKYKVEVFDSPNDQISDWITETSWTPNTTKTGLYNWHVKSIDVKTGKESGWGVVWQYKIGNNSTNSITEYYISVPEDCIYDPIEILFTPTQEVVYNYSFNGTYPSSDMWSLYDDQSRCIDDGLFRDNSSFSPPTLKVGERYKFVIYPNYYETKKVTIIFSSPVKIL